MRIMILKSEQQSTGKQQARKIQQKKMGQLLQKDRRPQLPNQIPVDNVRPVTNKKPFCICPFLQFESAEKIFNINNEQFVEALYKFGDRHTVHLQLKKQNWRKSPGIYLKLGDEYVYAYKHRKLDRSDNIKPEKLLFKKRMYVSECEIKSWIEEKGQRQKDIEVGMREKLMKKFAEAKFLSLLQIGPKLGRVYNGCDGVITAEYIEYFSQVTIDRIQNCIATNSQLKKLQKRLVDLGIFGNKVLKNENLSYSRWRKGYVLKQLHYYEPNLQISNKMSYDNQSIHFIIRMFETEITRAIMDLDNQAKMLPFINNLIFQHDYEKAISKFEESLPMIEDEDQKLQFAEEVSSMISKHSANSDKQYEKRIQKIVANSNLKENSKDSINSAKTSRNSSKISHPNLSPQKTITNSQFQTDSLSPHSQNQLTLNLSPNHKDTSPKLQHKDPIKNNPKIENNIQSLKPVNSKEVKVEFIELARALKTSILDKNNQKIQDTFKRMQNLQYKSPIEVQILFGKLLIESARSRHALTIFERLLYFSNEVPFSQIYHYYEIALLAGVIYFHRYAYKKALKAFEKALSILVRLRHYSIKMMTIHNNMACIYHVLKNYDQSLFHLHRGFRLGEYSVDYEYLMRSNMAMALVEKGRIRDAKNQMMKVNKIVEPINNMVIYCKFYSNLAYLQLLDPGDSKAIDKAVANFEEACNIEDKYLIPNGYKSSIFLHNNIAMLHYKRKEFKKAKMHSQKIINELNDVEGLVGVKVHFNIGKIFSQGYNYDLPLKHFNEAKMLLNKLDQGKQPEIRTYKQIVGKQIQELEKMRIDEVSEQESYKFSYMSSSLLKKV